MFKWLFNRKGQSTAEYAILIGLVVAAAIGMQTYVKRGLQGRVRDAVDHVGTGGDVGGATLTFTGKSWEPDYIDRSFTTQRATQTKTEVFAAGSGKISVGKQAGAEKEDETLRTGKQTIKYDKGAAIPEPGPEPK